MAVIHCDLGFWPQIIDFLSYNFVLEAEASIFRKVQSNHSYHKNNSYDIEQLDFKLSEFQLW